MNSALRHFFAGSSTEKAAAAARREAAKKRLAAAKAALKKDSQPAISFDAGFFKVLKSLFLVRYFFS